MLNGTSKAPSGATYKASGEVYRYVSVEEMLGFYTAEAGVDETTGEPIPVPSQQEYLKSLIAKWNKTYFDIDMETGAIAWKTDFASYKLLADNEEVKGNLIELDTVNTDNREKSFSVENAIGEVISSEKLTYEVQGDAVTLEGYKITAKGLGNATLNVKLGSSVIFSIEIKVTKPIENKLDNVIIFEQGKPLSFEVPGIDSAAIISAYTNDEGFAVKYVNGEVTVTECLLGETFELDLEDDTYIYRLSAICYTAYIETAQEFVEVFGYNQPVTSIDEIPELDGLYVLAKNIDLTGVEFANGFVGSSGTLSKNVGLTGTFDGQGYTVSNLVAPEGGLFGVVSGTIKNVAFINADVKVKVYSRELLYVEVGDENYDEKGTLYTVEGERAPARDQDGQLVYDGSTSSSGILCKYLYSGTLENVYMTWDNTNRIEFAEGTDNSNYKYYLNKVAIAMQGTTDSVLNNVYFDGDLKLFGTAANNEKKHLYFQNENNKVIFISDYIISNRLSSTRYGHPGTIEGSTTVGALGLSNIWSTQNFGIDSNNLKGRFYRYVSVEEMIDTYTKGETTVGENVVDMSTQQTNLINLLADWDKTYFVVDETTGVVTWNVK